MKQQTVRAVVVATAMLMIASRWPVPAFSQGVAAQTRTPAAPAAIPRMSDGKPDFSGVWQVLNSASWNIQGHSAEKGAPGGQSVVVGGEIPYLPSALAKRDENFKNRATADTVAKCYSPGVPRLTYMPFPFQIVQTPTYLSILYEYDHWVRHVYMNSKHPDGAIEFWIGDSRAQWDGDTLVIDVIDFNDQTWFDHS